MIGMDYQAAKDPRCNLGFLPELFPLSDFGDPPPVGASGKNDRIRLEFLAVYYAINLASLNLSTEVSKREEKGAFEQELNSLRKVRDELEDFYAPLGIIAEPTVSDDITVNIAFTFPNESRWFLQQQAAGPRQAQLQFQVPIPENENKK